MQKIYLNYFKKDLQKLYKFIEINEPRLYFNIQNTVVLNKIIFYILPKISKSIICKNQIITTMIFFRCMAIHRLDDLGFMKM